MKRTLIRYKTKPEMADKNAELIAAVFAELKAAQPEGVRYLSLRLDDDTFIHFVETEADDGASALPKLAAFQGVPERHSRALRRTAAGQRRYHRRQLPDAGRSMRVRLPEAE